MPIDVSMYGGGGREKDAFDYLGDLMQFKQQRQQLKSNEIVMERNKQLIQQRQMEIDEERAIGDAFKMYTPNAEPEVPGTPVPGQQQQSAFGAPELPNMGTPAPGMPGAQPLPGVPGQPQQAQQAQPSQPGQALEIGGKPAVAPGEPDIAKIVHHLNKTGYGKAAQTVYSGYIDQVKKKSDEMKATMEAENLKLDMGLAWLAGIPDTKDVLAQDAAYQRALPMVKKMLPQYAHLLPGKYDKGIVDQLIATGRTVAEQNAHEQLVFTKGQQAIENTRNLANDATKLYGEITTAVGSSLELAKNGADWDNRLGMFQIGFAHVPDNVRTAAFAQFGKWEGPQSAVHAGKLSMSFKERAAADATARNASVAERNAKVAEDNLARLQEDDKVELLPETVEFLSDAVARDPRILSILGTGSANNRAKVLNRVGEKYKNLDIVSQAAAYKANTAALVDTERRLANVSQYEATFLHNVGVMNEQIHKLVELKSPFLNQRVRDLQKGFTTDKTVSNFIVARDIAMAEAAKLTTGGSNLQGATTVSALSDFKNLISGDMTVGAMLDASKLIERDARNRVAAMEAGRDQIKKNIAATPRATMNFMAGQSPAEALASAGGAGTGAAPAAPTAGPEITDRAKLPTSKVPPNLSKQMTIMGGKTYFVTSDAQGNITALAEAK